jgi:hypothetical protein
VLDGICEKIPRPRDLQRSNLSTRTNSHNNLEPWQPPTPANNNSIIYDPTGPTLPPAWSMIYDESAYKEMQKYSCKVGYSQSYVQARCKD